MKRACFAGLIILWISCFSFVAINTPTLENSGNVTLSQSPTVGPTIEWPYTTEGLVMAWDGIYNGQTEQVWGSDAWVNDSDGVDCVIFRYRWTSQTEWINRTTILMDGNDTRGRYYGNFTYDVWWNWESGRVETEGDGASFKFKIFANDSLGNWCETIPVGYSGGYDLIYPPENYELFVSMIYLAIIGFAIVVIVCITWLVRKYR